MLLQHLGTFILGLGLDMCFEPLITIDDLGDQIWEQTILFVPESTEVLHRCFFDVLR